MTDRLTHPHDSIHRDQTRRAIRALGRLAAVAKNPDRKAQVDEEYAECRDAIRQMAIAAGVEY